MSAAVITISDPVFVKRERYNFFNRSILKFIRDERDLPFVYLCLKITFLVIPVAVYLFVPGNFKWWIAVPYLALNLGIGLGPFVLMLHNTCHRKLFKEKYAFLNNYIPWVLGPFYGETPETYFYHHVGMHHAENNLPPDTSATIHFQRDSIKDFFIYFSTFFFKGIVELIGYFRMKQKSRFIQKILTGESAFFLLCIILSIFNWRATLVVFILPFVLVRFAMMAGNWAQHAFIDASEPWNNYKNSITCINSTYNRKCFNDGYHIGHHLKPGMHWTDMPGDFLSNREKYVKNKAIVFEHLDFFVIWFFLMTKNYKYLASKYVDIGNNFSSQEEIINFLKERTAKIDIVRTKSADPSLIKTSQLL